MTSITQEVCKEAGVKPRDAERSKNFFALGLVSWLYTRPVEPTVEWITERFAAKPQVAEANTRAFRAGLRLRRDGRAVRVQLRGPAGDLREGRVRPGHREPGARLGPDHGLPAGRAAALPRELPDHPGLGHPARAQPAQGVRDPHLPGRGRDRRHRRRPGRVLRRCPRGHHDQRPGPRPQVRDDRPGHQPRAAARHRRRPARRALHRAAHQDRAGRPAPRHVRPPRRGAAADPGAADAERLLRRGDRGDPAGREVPHAGDPALRRLPGQRGRAVAPARPRHVRADRARASPPSPTTSTTTATPTFWPYVRDPETLARPWAPPGLPGPRAPHRRPREGRRQRQRVLRGRQPRAHGPPAPGQDRRDRRRHPAGRGERRDGRRAAAPRQLGLDLRRRGGRREAGPRPGHEGGPRAPAPPEPAAGQPGRGARTATRRCSCPRSTSAS